MKAIINCFGIPLAALLIIGGCAERTTKPSKAEQEAAFRATMAEKAKREKQRMAEEEKRIRAEIRAEHEAYTRVLEPEAWGVVDPVLRSGRPAPEAEGRTVRKSSPAGSEHLAGKGLSG